MANEKQKSLIAHAKELAKKADKLLSDATDKKKNPVAVLAEARNWEKQWLKMLKDSLIEKVLDQDEYDTMALLMGVVSAKITAKEKKSWKEETSVLNGMEAMVFHGFLSITNAAIADKEKSFS